MATADVAAALDAARRAAARVSGVFDALLATLGAHSHEHAALGASPAASTCRVVVGGSDHVSQSSSRHRDGCPCVGGNATPRALVALR